MYYPPRTTFFFEIRDADQESNNETLLFKNILFIFLLIMSVQHFRKSINQEKKNETKFNEKIIVFFFFSNGVFSGKKTSQIL